MIFYSRTSSIRSFILSLVSTLVLASGCVKPQSRATDPNANFDGMKESETANTSFYNEKVTGSAIVAKTATGFSIPTEKQYTFETIIKEKRTQETIKGHKFIIRGGEKDITVRSTQAGLVTWTETISYNLMSETKYLPINRVIEADGMHKGARRLKIAINPWDVEGSKNEVRDLDQQPVPSEQLAASQDVSRLLSGVSKNGEQATRSLWIDDFRVNVVQNVANGTGALDISFTSVPKIPMVDVKGDSKPMSLTDGSFTGQFWVIAKTETRACSIVAKTGPIKNMRMTNGKLMSESPMRIQYQNTFGQLEIVGSFTPEDGPPTLLPFEGVWLMGDHAQLSGFKMPVMREPTYNQRTHFSATTYVKDCVDVSNPNLGADDLNEKINQAVSKAQGATGSPSKLPVDKSGLPPEFLSTECIRPADLPALFPGDEIANRLKNSTELLSCVNRSLPSGISKLEQFEISLVQSFRGVTPAPIVDPIRDETTTERRIRFFVTPKITNPLAGGVAVRDVEFTIEKDDGSIERQRTNQDGELRFGDYIKHKYYVPEKFYIRTFKISNSTGYSKRLAIVFNPWDPKNATFARDLRLLNKHDVAEVNLVERPRSELVIVSVQWGTQRFRYEIDDFLNMKMFKTYNLTMSPLVVRYSSLTEGRGSREALRDGVYLLKIAVQKDYELGDRAKRLEYITTVRRLVRVKAGIVNTPVEMAFRDFRILKLRSNLLIEMAPVDESLLPLVPTIMKDENGELVKKVQRSIETNEPLDSLIARDSGLSPRTFVGPVVAYSNGFSATMRPTDELDEQNCVTIDCDEGKRKTDKVVESKAKKEDKIYEGDIRHLADISVSDLVKRHDAQEKKYVESMQQQSRLAEFVKAFNFEYAAVQNESAILSKDPELAKNNQVLTPGASLLDLLNRMRKIDPKKSFHSGSLINQAEVFRTVVNSKPVKSSDITNQIVDGSTLDRATLLRLCPVLIEDLVLRANAETDNQKGIFSGSGGRSARLNANDMCLQMVMQAKNEREFPISFDRKLRVFNIRKDPRRLGGSLMFLGLGADVSYGVSESTSVSFSPLNAVGGLLKVGGAVTGAPAWGFAEKLLDATGLSLSYSRSESRGAGSGVSSGLNVAVELRAMKLSIDRYERCVGFRLGNQFLSLVGPQLMGAMSPNLSIVEKAQRLTRGILVCEGQVQTNPVMATERYYQFSQSLGDEVMNDPVALENHPYLLSVRGRSDYTRFVNIVQQIPNQMKVVPLSADERNVMEPTHWDSLGEAPIGALSKVFSEMTPTFPGFLTVEPGTNLQPVTQ